MALRNRVTPLNEIVADPARGLVYGNRGCLHDAERPDPPRLRRPPLDRVPPRVQGLAARPAAAARQVHRAVLPRRGDRVRRRAPAVRAVPARGLRPLRRALGRRTTPASAAPTRSTLRLHARAPHAPTGTSAGTTRRFGDAARRRVRPARRRAVARARRRAAALDRRGLHRPRGAARGRRARGRDHPALARRRAARGLGRPVVPLVHPSGG